MYFRNIFEKTKTRTQAQERMQQWFSKINNCELPTMISVGESIKNNLGKILNYFPTRDTNAAAESFNAKLKGFRALVRGIRDEKFFLFRIHTFYA